MRRRLLAMLFVSACWLPLAAAPAEAFVLTSANWSQVVRGVPMTRTAAGLSSVGGSSGDSISVHLTYHPFSTAFFIPKPPSGQLTFHVGITQGGSDAITATPAMANATMGIPGTVVTRTAMHVAKGTGASMFSVGPNTLLRVPLSQGKAGQFTSAFTILGAAHALTVDFYGWTPNALTFTDLTEDGVALPDVVAMGSFMVFTNAATVTLVSPTRIRIDGPLAQRRTASFTTLKMVFLPEPATLLLLAAGAAAVGLGVPREGR